MEDIVEMLRQYRPARRRIMMGDCDAMLSDPKVSEERRIAGIKILVGLLPLSLEALERRLKLQEGQRAYENHFTICCFLDLYVLDAIGVAQTVKRRILKALAEYLHNVGTETAHAAWACGDLLGDHWEGSRDAIDILLVAAQRARFVPGRLGALHGIEYWVKSRFYPGSRTSGQVTDALFRASNLDKSERARFRACGIVDPAVSRVRSAKERLAILRRLHAFVAENPLNDDFKECCLSMLRKRATSDASMQVRSCADRMIREMKESFVAKSGEGGL